MGGALALDAAWVLAAVLVILILAAVGIGTRRFLLERGGGTVECGLRRGDGPWRLGLASYQSEELYWFSVFRVSILAAHAQLADEVDADQAQRELDSALAEAEPGPEEPAEAKYARAQLRVAGRA